MPLMTDAGTLRIQIEVGIVRDRSLLKMTDDEFDDVVRIHAKSTFWVGQLAARHMKARGQGGTIINTTSGAHFGNFGQTNYGGAKGMIASMTYTWAVELARYGIRVNAISPAATTRMTAVAKNPDGSAVDRVPRAKLDFRYRALEGLAPGSVIVAATFATGSSTPEAVQADVDRVLAQRAATQPLDVPSCGSVFKNPEGHFAGRLVEEAGLRGASEGGAQISPIHANFIANTGGASAADVVALIDRAREAVSSATGIVLETEVKMLGRKA